MLPQWFLRIVGVALIGFGIYDFKVYWRLILRNEPAGHAWLRLGVVAVLVFYYAIGALLIVFS